MRSGFDADKALLGRDGQNLFAVQGDVTSLVSNRVSVPTAQAVGQPMEVSTSQVNEALAAKQSIDTQ